MHVVDTSVPRVDSQEKREPEPAEVIQKGEPKSCDCLGVEKRPKEKNSVRFEIYICLSSREGSLHRVAHGRYTLTDYSDVEATVNSRPQRLQG